MNQLFELLRQCTVRIDVPSGCGTGFFAAPGKVLTCAHVAESWQNDPSSIKIHYDNNEYRPHNVELLSKPYPDLGLLSVDLDGHPCVHLDPRIQPGHRLWAYGYTRARASGEAVTVEYEGPAMLSREQRLLKFKTGQVVPGYSGGPLLNTQTCSVCGLVKSTRDRATDLGGGGIPAETILTKFPDLKILHDSFHERDNRWAEAVRQQRESALRDTWQPNSNDLKSKDNIFHHPPDTWVSPVRCNQSRFKVAAFDLDGTLLRGDGFRFSWEIIWKSLGFSTGIQNDLRREYRKSASDASRDDRIAAYSNWCEKASDQFKRRGLNRAQLKEFSQTLTLTNNCRKALAELRAKGVVIAIISGGVNTFLEDRFPDFRNYVDFAFINELIFSPSGSLEGVRATPYDFEGKAEALEVVCERTGCTCEEAVFVGDRFNDESIMHKAEKAIAYPPEDDVIEGMSHVRIPEDNLLAVVEHIIVD